MFRPGTAWTAAVCHRGVPPRLRSERPGRRAPRFAAPGPCAHPPPKSRPPLPCRSLVQDAQGADRTTARRLLDPGAIGVVDDLLEQHHRPVVVDVVDFRSGGRAVPVALTEFHVGGQSRHVMSVLVSAQDLFFWNARPAPASGCTVSPVMPRAWSEARNT